MNLAGAVAVLAFATAMLRVLCAHVTILPGVVMPVAGLVFITELAAVACFAWWMIRRARRNTGYRARHGYAS
jgi:hypothetical protein